MDGTASLLLEAHLPSVRRIFERRRPAALVRHHAHAVGAKRVKLAHRPIDRHGLDIGVARDLQVPVERREEVGASLVRVRPLQEREQRMLVELGRPVVEQKADRRGRLRHHPHRSVDDRVERNDGARF
jgi:hypothetical protein